MIDRATVVARGGTGGNGATSFHREKFVPRGGPDGGDGGRGGDVILAADSGEDTLQRFQHRRVLKAQPGGNGGPNNRHGRRGATLRVRVPMGTQVYRGDGPDREFVGDLTTPGQELVVARGGRGGWGNARFSSSVRQAPHFAEKGLPGEDWVLSLELKLLADVGIVGLPNAGKSTLLAAVSSARPRVGDYPFTTLEPVLGVVEQGYRRLVFADIPGLIEGAHEGAGLGLEFLRHIERTRVLIHLLDASSEEVVSDFETVNRELELYGLSLESKPQVVALNKVDIPAAMAALPRWRRELAAHGVDEVLAVSAAARVGLGELVTRVFAAVAALPEPEPPAEEIAVLRPRMRQEVTVERDGETYVVHHRRAEMLSAMLDVANHEARRELVERLRRMGVVKALEKAGVQPGQVVRIGPSEWAWEA